MDRIELSLEFLARVLGTSAGAISEAITTQEGETRKPKDGYEHTLETKFQDKFKAIKSAGHDEGHGRASREVLTKLEKEIKEKYGVDVDGDIKAIVDHVVSKGASGITPETIKNHPVFVELVQKQADKYKKLENDFGAYKAAVLSEKQTGLIKTGVLSILENKENKYQVPENDGIRENILKAAINAITSKAKWQIKDGDKPELLPLDEQGNPVRDENHNPLGFQAIAVNVLDSFFEKGQTQQRNYPGNKTTGNGNGTTTSYPVFKSKAEAWDYGNSLKTVQEKAEFSKHFTQLEASGTLN